ncbi:TnsA endonuclease N-terminal domain-containing protein [Deefgea tanakiae]|uniref:TnsA endonuclease N-terminal domain-containing protein n=1 Tax=Deefgea tanakiae TaxID=2865840 RepID=A0ABX8Z4G4_9NEIS|nr:TnsA endonuclease N-terminal domain-containing protein [Deefgea tanakiae]QZA77467.1 TnsA endonuclease N-terminal domain-containing protein [Deefgea tanakiae]
MQLWAAQIIDAARVVIMPTRRITRSPVKVTGTVPDGQVFESTLEEDFFTLLRFNRLIESFEAQPVTVEWLDDAKKIRTYTPDVLVRYRKDLQESANLSPVLCEVKPDFNEASKSPRRRGPPRTENSTENEQKWAAARVFAARRGWEFKVVRESEIRTPYLANVRFLLRYVERDVESRYESALLAVLVEHSVLSLEAWAGQLSKSLEERAKLLPTCYRLIALQTVVADLKAPLTLNTLIKARGNV